MDSNFSCPSCKAPLVPKVLGCTQCEVKVEGSFEFNEFAMLSPEDLHFLRIFIQSEGRIREMEPALGLSYPTIRTRITALKNKLAGIDAAEIPKEETIQSTLALLEKKKISFDEAMAKIKKLKK